jgi:hypothetical protein
MAAGFWRRQQCLDHLGKFTFCISHRRLLSDDEQEWRTQLRSSLHPALFAAVYRVAADLADVCGLSWHARAELLLAAPKVTQALFAALIDCYTWKLAGKVYGRGSRTARTTVCDHPAILIYQYLIFDPTSFSLPCPSAARGSGSAQRERCPIVLRLL